MSERFLQDQVPQQIAEAYTEFVEALPEAEKNQIFNILGVGSVTRLQMADHMSIGDDIGIKLANIFLSMDKSELAKQGKANPTIEELIQYTTQEFRGAALNLRLARNQKLN